MLEYHKINSVYKRNMDDGFKSFKLGEYADDSFEFLANNKWVWTEKVDGMNMRVMFMPDGTVKFAGKTDNALLPMPLVERLRVLFPGGPEAASTKLWPEGGVCLYGEGYGGKIQKGSAYRQDQDFVLFDIFANNTWFDRAAVEGIAKQLGVECVPVVGTGTLAQAVTFTSIGFKSKWGTAYSEGIVLRPEVELQRRGRRVISKLKARDFH